MGSYSAIIDKGDSIEIVTTNVIGGNRVDIRRCTIEKRDVRRVKNKQMDALPSAYYRNSGCPIPPAVYGCELCLDPHLLSGYEGPSAEIITIKYKELVYTDGAISSVQLYSGVAGLPTVTDDATLCEWLCKVIDNVCSTPQDPTLPVVAITCNGGSAPDVLPIEGAVTISC